MDILGALSKLDPTNDDQWTDDGLPRVGALEALGLKNVTRGKITAAAPAFTRFNTTIDPDGDDLPEGAPPELPAQETNFQMESSEFGGGAPLGSEAPPVPKARPTSPDAAKAALEAADEAVAKAQKAATAAKAAEAQAQALRDAALGPLDRTRTPNEKQAILMGYLNSVAPSKKLGEQVEKAQPAPIDAVHARQLGYGKQKPNFPSR